MVIWDITILEIPQRAVLGYFPNTPAFQFPH